MPDLKESQYLTYAREHDALGWDCFLEGRIASSLLDIQKDCLYRSDSYQKIKSWSKQFIHHMLCVSHRQWLYRNARVHLKKVEGRSLEDHEKVRDATREMLDVQPDDLLPCHQHLLKIDYEALGSGSTRDRLLWLNKMEAAIASKRATVRQATQRRNRRRRGSGHRVSLSGGLHDSDRSNLSKKEKEPAAPGVESGRENRNG